VLERYLLAWECGSMAQIIENWADISGTVISVQPAEDRQDYTVVVVQVDGVEAVPASPGAGTAYFPNLLADAQGSSMSVLFPNSVVQQHGVRAGVRITCRIRKIPGGAFVHPDHIVITP
jgi:hypothetical protein